MLRMSSALVMECVLNNMLSFGDRVRAKYHLGTQDRFLALQLGKSKLAVGLYGNQTKALDEPQHAFPAPPSEFCLAELWYCYY